MQFIYFCLLFIINTSVNSFSQQNIVELLSVIVNNYFPTERCIYYVSDTNNTPTSVEMTLMQINKQVCSVNLQKIQFLDKMLVNCAGYIIVVENAKLLREQLAKTFAFQLNFEPHKRILLFLSDNKTHIQEYPFNVACGYFGLDIVVLNGIPYDVNSALFSTKLSDRKEITLTTLRNGDNFTAMNNGFEFDIDKKAFETIKWKPNFFIQNYEKTFKVAYIHYFPFTQYTKEKGLYGGVEYDIIKEITKSWPVEFQYRSIENNIYYIFLNETNYGLYDTHIGGQWMHLVMLFKAAVTFPYTQFCITFLVPKPRLLSNLTFIFQAFRISLWALLWASILFLFILIYLSIKGFHYLHPSFVKNNSTLVFFDLIRIVTSGSSIIFPVEMNYLRQLLNSWSIMSLLIVTFYSAGFTVSMRFPRYTKPANTLKDIADMNIKWVYMTENTLKWIDAFSDPALERLRDSFVYESNITIRNKYLANNFATIAKVLPGKVLADVDTFDDYGKTHLQVMPGCTLVLQIAIALSKNSPFQELFKIKIMKFLEYGLVHRWYSKISKNPKYNYLNNFYTYYVDVQKIHPFTLEKLQGVFLLLISGHLISIVAFTVERLMKTCT